MVLGDAATEDDVREPRQPGQLAREVLVPCAVLDDRCLASEPTRFAERGAGDVVELDEEVEGLVGIVALGLRHEPHGFDGSPRDPAAVLGAA
jgi:hypothetical protein